MHNNQDQHSVEAGTHKVLSFGIPSYNAAADIDRCVESILEGSDYAADIEIIIVDDGSKDETPQKADEWEARYPGIIRAVHQENGGHGMAVLAGLRNATGTYYKVVDSDDWLDASALSTMLSILRGFEERDTRVDLFISNYVYEKVYEGTRTAISYKTALPRKRVFSWDEIGRFLPSQNLLMHSLCYRRDVLLDGDLPLPAHTFYVDNIYAYVPLPRCKTIYYADIDLYRYFIGRDDQSVNEQVMIKRVDQQLRVTRIMLDFYSYDTLRSFEPKLGTYMLRYLSMMMMISSIFLIMSEEPENLEKKDKLWKDLKAKDPAMYKKLHYRALSIAGTFPGKGGRKLSIGLYHIAQKIYKFN